MEIVVDALEAELHAYDLLSPMPQWMLEALDYLFDALEYSHSHPDIMTYVVDAAERGLEIQTLLISGGATPTMTEECLALLSAHPSVPVHIKLIDQGGTSA